MLLTSVFSILLAMVFLVSSTWAWFTTDVTPQASSTIKASSFQIEELSCDTLNSKKVPHSNLTEYYFFTDEDTYTAVAGTYTFTVLANGTGKGYCKIVVVTTVEENGSTVPVEEIYYTGSISTGAPHSFSIHLPNAAMLKVIPVWGYYAGTEVIEVTAAAAP